MDHKWPVKQATSATPKSGALSLPTAENITISWLLQHVPMKFWLTLAGAFSTAFSAGMASANLNVIQSLFATRSSVDLPAFVNKAVTEKGTYTIGTGADAIEMYVADVSIARKVVTIEIGLAGHTKERIDVSPNQERSIAIGSKAFTLVVHDVADATLGADIAVLSLQEKQ